MNETIAIDDTATTTDPATVTEIDSGPAEAVLLDDELLVEEISIDGMCGVY